MQFEAAAAYAERHTLHALIIAVDGDTVVHQAGRNDGLQLPHALYSGTKSFWGIAAAAAVDDDILALDEPVVDTITEWRSDAHKGTMTIRQLLDLTSGYGFGGLGNAVPTAAKAIATPLKTEPGSTFTYGGVPLQVFGELLRRKLAPAYDSPHDYLRARILERSGVAVDFAAWRTLSDGTRTMPTGAFLSAQAWLAYGLFLLDRGRGVMSDAAFAACVTGSERNPRYGLGFWLDVSDGEALFYASGAGGQGLYVIPSRRIVAVHFGKSTAWNHGAFIKRLLAN